MVIPGLKQGNDIVQIIFTTAVFAIMYQIAWERDGLGEE